MESVSYVVLVLITSSSHLVLLVPYWLEELQFFFSLELNCK